MQKIHHFFAYVVLLTASIWSGKTYAQFPYSETFRNTNAPGVVFGGDTAAFLTAGKVATDTDGNGYLRLTNATTYQKGYVHGNAQFPTTYGLKATFEYFSYGGTGADGICFFLFDALASPFKIGGFGGSLGYAQYNTTPTSPGVSKGYLGIGLDEFGNFSNPTEGRQGGISGLRPSSVTLRGKGDDTAMTTGNYQYLTSIQTTGLSPSFSIAGGARTPLPTGSGYRKVYLELKPRTDSGYDITLQITTGGSTPVVHNILTAYAYKVKAPANLKFGISASTGASTNYHEIRNLLIDVYDPSPLLTPTAKDTSVIACYGTPLQFSALANIVLPNTPAAADSASVRFITPGTGVRTAKLVLSGMGTFSTDTVFGAKGLISFTPEPGFSGNVTPVQYTFKDNYGKWSSTGKINITVRPEITNNIISLSSAYTISGSTPAGGTGSYTFQWRYSTTDSLSGFSNAPGAAAGKDYATPVLTGNAWYTRIVSSGGCSTQSKVLALNKLGTALPLRLLSFGARAQNGIVLLDWTTADEAQLLQFIVERSDMQQDWMRIAAQTPKGDGTYGITDLQPLQGMNYYRLLIRNLDGSTDYSPVVRVLASDSKQASISVFPNPATDAVHIESVDKNAVISIYDATGKLVYSGMQQDISIGHWLPGTYYVSLLQQGQATSTIPLIKH
jgi:hypothetical protein